MRALTKYLLVAFVFGYYVGCANKKFAVDEAKITESCQAALGCSHVGGTDFYNYSITVGGGQVDILFVDDNSASMSFEQNLMAERFSNFLEALEARSIDYRIGITTTDISSAENPARAINQNGALQDGRLVQFSDGNYFLTPQSGSAATESEKKAQRIQWFAEAIQRNETKTCETFISAHPEIMSNSADYIANCPSGDERGIYAANLFVTQNPQSMIRPQSHLAVVILSDEDVRSSLYYKTNSIIVSDLDLPQTLVNKVKTTYPDKTLSVHSIIVKPGELNVSIETVTAAFADLTYDPINSGYQPSSYFQNGDQVCLNAQSGQIPGTTNISGSYGYFYAVLTRLTGGIEGDICASSSSYATQLYNIGTQISERVQEVALRCDNISDLTVDVLPTVSGLTHEVVGSAVKFNQALPAGTKVNLTYSCPSIF